MDAQDHHRETKVTCPPPSIHHLWPLSHHQGSPLSLVSLSLKEMGTIPHIGVIKVKVTFESNSKGKRPQKGQPIAKARTQASFEERSVHECVCVCVGETVQTRQQ